MKSVQEKLQQIDDLYRPTLNHLDHYSEAPILITFSGPINSGKTTLAKELEAEFRAVRIENDGVRRIIRSLWPELGEDDVDDLKNQYGEYLLTDLVESSMNKLWILDASVDRTLSRVRHFTNKHSFRVILISFNLSDQEHRRRAAASEKNYSDIFELTAQTVRDQKSFLASNKADITITDDPDSRINALASVRLLVASYSRDYRA